MTEKKFTDKLEGLRSTFKLNLLNHFLLPGMKSFYKEVFLKAVKNSCSGEIPGLIPEATNQILKKFKEKSIPNLTELRAADDVHVLNMNLMSLSIAFQRILSGGYICRA